MTRAPVRSAVLAALLRSAAWQRGSSTATLAALKVATGLFGRVEAYRGYYLASPYWARRRMRFVKQGDGRCVRCGKRATDVHHVSYARLGRERDRDLALACRACHVGLDYERRWGKR